jgi:hypothetical protein
VDWQELFPSRGALALAVLVCVLAPIALVGLQIDKNPKFSPVDETAHFDYVERVSRGELPRQGERVTDTTLRELACRGSATTGFRTPPCNLRVLRYQQFSNSWSYETQHTPVYYALTAAMRAVADKLGAANLLVATRISGIVWLVAGLLLLWAAARVMGIEPLPLAAGLLLLAVSPVVIYTSAIVNNDGTALAGAGLVALPAALAYRGRLRRTWLWLGLAAAFAASLKATNFFPAVAIAGVFAIAAVREEDSFGAALRRFSRDGGALLVGGLVVIVAWSIVYRSRSLVSLDQDPTLAVLRGTPQTAGLLLREAVDLLFPLTHLAGGFTTLTPDTLEQQAQTPFYALLAFLLIGGALAGLFVSPRRWSHALGMVAVPALYLGGVALGLSLMKTYDSDPGLAGRYGLAMAPLMMLATVASLQGKWAQRAVAAFAGAFLCTTLVVMLT